MPTEPAWTPCSPASVPAASRFESLDAMLQDDVEMFEPASQSGPMHYYFNELPDGTDTESFIASWANGE